MQGVVLGFDKKTGKGILSGEDKKRYDFCLEDWRSEKTLPEEGVKVDFEIIKKEVVNIYALAPKEVVPVEENDDNNLFTYFFIGLLTFAGYLGYAKYSDWTVILYPLLSIFGMGIGVAMLSDNKLKNTFKYQKFIGALLLAFSSYYYVRYMLG